MEVKLSYKDYIVFDLDDTLYKEVDYLKSAFRFIAHQLMDEIGHNIYDEMLLWKKEDKVVLDTIFEKYDIQKFSIKDLLYLYRFHQPDIKLGKGVKKTLNYLQHHQIRMGITTDGRSLSQRNKLVSLGIEHYFNKVVISADIGSEKPNAHNYLAHLIDYPEGIFTYIGDNFHKDFVTPNRLGWRTIGLLDDGRNIHSQNMDLPNEFLPEFVINSFEELQFSIL